MTLQPENSGNRAGQFRPGQSGNPGGRPKGVIEVIELARKHTTAAIGTLVTIIRLLSRMRLVFEPIGELVQYHGLRQPCGAHLADLIRRTREERAPLWCYAAKSALTSADSTRVPVACESGAERLVMIRSCEPTLV
jgi:Family of unknown function (DUF5681)